MYDKSQLRDLFALIEALSIGNSPLESNALDNLRNEAARLKALDQVPVLGTHEHKHGATHYLFLVPQGRTFGGNDLEAYLAEHYEPELEELLSTHTMTDPVIVL